MSNSVARLGWALLVAIACSLAFSSIPDLFMPDMISPSRRLLVIAPGYHAWLTVLIGILGGALSQAPHTRRFRGMTRVWHILASSAALWIGFWATYGFVYVWNRAPVGLGLYWFGWWYHNAFSDRQFSIVAAVVLWGCLELAGDVTGALREHGDASACIDDHIRSYSRLILSGFFCALLTMPLLSWIAGYFQYAPVRPLQFFTRMWLFPLLSLFSLVFLIGPFQLARFRRLTRVVPLLVQASFAVFLALGALVSWLVEGSYVPQARPAMTGQPFTSIIVGTLAYSLAMLAVIVRVPISPKSDRLFYSSENGTVCEPRETGLERTRGEGVGQPER